MISKNASDYIVFGKPKIEDDEIEEVVDSLKTGWLGTGPKTQAFEKKFREYIGCRHAIAVNSCTAAMHLSLIAAGVGNGDEVITSPITFAATANTIVHVGAKPIFVDVNKDSMNIDEDAIESAITKKTKAILPVHFAGRPCEMDRIIEIAEKHGLNVIGDAAHAIESTKNGKKIGNVGASACFSFYVTKNITTGEGGMVTTNNDEWAEKIRVMSLHGISADAWERYSWNGFKHYQVLYPGFKYNMTDLQAALGIHQLKRIEKNWKIRKKIWESYQEQLSGLPLILPKEPEEDSKHSFHLYTPLLDIDMLGISRDEFQQMLHKRGIGTGIHFISLHLHPYYKENFNYGENDFPNAKFISDRTISLPLSPALKEQEVEHIITNVKRILKKNLKK
ncbi:MAG: DegT/DnrJ/EryC1/StrS family aminotransferase [Candidatus Diapherotrites archaeon]